MQSIGPRRAVAENPRMTKETTNRVLVRRPAAAATDTARDESAAGDDAELELVSTQMLKQILSSRDIENRKGIEDAARRGRDGVLARDPVTGFFQVIGDEELQAIVDSGQALPKLSRPSDVTLAPLHDYADSQNLSLVSIQALRRVLNDGEADADDAMADGEEFDPYAA